MTVRSNMISMNSVNKLQSQCSSRHRNATQKVWGTKKGAVACPENSALNAGIGILNVCDNKSAMLDEDSPLFALLCAEPCSNFELVIKKRRLFDEGYGGGAKVTGLFDRSVYVSC